MMSFLLLNILFIEQSLVISFKYVFKKQLYKILPFKNKKIGQRKV